MNNTTTELEIKVSGGRIVKAEVLANGTCKLVIETGTVSKLAYQLDTGMFELIEASKITLNDDVLQYNPKTDAERKFKERLEMAIRSGKLKDFWRPKCDPSFDFEYEELYYKLRDTPIKGISFNDSKDIAQYYNSKCNIRIGTKFEYVAFLAVLIKKLVVGGWSLEMAWNAVCNDSVQLGHYRNSENSKDTVEQTGRREICGFYDLANTRKFLDIDEGDDEIIQDNKCGFWLASGCYRDFSDERSLAYMDYMNMDTTDDYADFLHNYTLSNTVPWMVITDN